MIKRQEYLIKEGNVWSGGFPTDCRDFGMPVLFDDYKLSNQFFDLIHHTISAMAWNKQAHSYKATLVSDSNNNYSIYADHTLLAKVRDGKLVHLWLPSWTKFVEPRHYDYSAFFQGKGTQDLVCAGFPDLVHGGKGFLREAKNLKRLFVPNMKNSGEFTLLNSQIERLDFPSVTKLGDSSLTNDDNLIVFNGPKLVEVRDWFAYGCSKLNSDGLNIPRLKRAGKICHPLIYDAIQKNQEKHQ